MADDQHLIGSKDIILTNIDSQKECIKTTNMIGEKQNENVVKPCLSEDCLRSDQNQNEKEKGMEEQEVIPNKEDNIKIEKDVLALEPYDKEQGINGKEPEVHRTIPSDCYNNAAEIDEQGNHCIDQDLSNYPYQHDSQRHRDEMMMQNYQFMYDQSMSNMPYYNGNGYYPNYYTGPNYQEYNIHAYQYYQNLNHENKFKQPQASQEERQFYDPMVFYTEDSELERKYLKKDKSRNSLKPPYSYSQLITKAIEDSPNGILTLSEIYKYIKENFDYYRKADITWQNSIRHNLSLNKMFKKVARPTNKPGKGGYWTMDYEFISNGSPYKRYKRKSDTPVYDQSHSIVSKKMEQGNDSDNSAKCRDIDYYQDFEKKREDKM